MEITCLGGRLSFAGSTLSLCCSWMMTFCWVEEVSHAGSAAAAARLLGSQHFEGAGWVTLESTDVPPRAGEMWVFPAHTRSLRQLSLTKEIDFDNDMRISVACNVSI